MAALWPACGGVGEAAVSDRDEILADGEARIVAALREAEEHEARMREAVYEADRVREQIEASTGVRLNDPLSSRPVGTLDEPIAALGYLAEQCRIVVKAADLLESRIREAPERPLGAVLKTVDAGTAALVMRYLRGSEMFPDLGEQAPEKS